MIPIDLMNGWTVVAIDDEPDSLDVVTLLLEMYGATVIGAENGQVGLEKIRQHRPRFVISDLTMPEMTGWDLIEALKRESRPISEIPVIALTAHAMDHDRSKAIQMGFYNFITKPLHPETFVNQVLSFLADSYPDIAAYV
jgi:CheY-like chemotaxis protein